MIEWIVKKKRLLLSRELQQKPEDLSEDATTTSEYRHYRKDNKVRLRSHKVGRR
ncbi:MAG: hypothetical protein HQK52_23060 [Oligoflexia bacterium]|nr:hypothetical protein [Oligoflexia bacterium]